MGCTIVYTRCKKAMDHSNEYFLCEECFLTEVILNMLVCSFNMEKYDVSVGVGVDLGETR